MPKTGALPKALLIANRGEIALRIARTALRLGIEVCGVFSSADHGQPHLRLCKRAKLLEGDPSKVYLDQKLIIQAAKDLNCTAIHPGYGFLSENQSFSALVENEGLIFVGPTAEQIEKLGNKVVGRKVAEENKVPTVPGSTAPIKELKEAEKVAKKIGFPILIKAASGGGGRGMRVVEEAKELAQALERVKAESQVAFADDRVFIEKYFPKVRHIEIQILGDGKGKAISLGARDCSVQRRHQKLIEESPPCHLSEATIQKMGECGERMAATCNYRGAGTFEFLVPSGSEDFYFIEMNTRLQVEHPVTELCTGLDLVEEQLRIAGGLGFSFDPKDLNLNGHAIEVRIIAEDATKNFQPSLGHLDAVVWPSGIGVRVDASAERELEVSPFYDSLLGKVITYGRTREEALERLDVALRETLIGPIATTAPFLFDLINNKAFREGNYDTSLIAPFLKECKAEDSEEYLNATTVLLAAGMFGKNADSSSSFGSKVNAFRGRGLNAWQRADKDD